MRVSALATIIREELLSAEGVRKLVLSRRASVVYSSGTPANHVFFLETGLVKIERSVDSSREILLSIAAPGEVFGEQALTGDGVFTTSARVLESGLAWSIPSEAFLRLCERRPDVWRLVVQHCVARSESLERKIEHLCHSDVRERLIFYLGELAKLTPGNEPSGSVIHISQNELASLVGATRETTSTTLNALARQGLVALGHRLVMIPSLDLLQESARTKTATAGVAPQS